MRLCFYATKTFLSDNTSKREYKEKGKKNKGKRSWVFFLAAGGGVVKTSITTQYGKIKSS